MAYTSPLASIIPVTPDDAEAQLRAMLGLGPNDPLPVAAPMAPTDDQSQQGNNAAPPVVGGPVVTTSKDDSSSKNDDLESALISGSQNGATPPVVGGPITSPDDLESALIANPSAPSTAAAINPKIAAPGASAPAQGAGLSPDVLAAQNKLATVRAQGSGVSHHGGFLKALDIAGSILAPGVMSAIPGTTLNYAAKVRGAQNQVNQAMDTQAKTMQIQDTAAQAAERQANLKAKPKTPSLIRNPVTGMIEGIDNGDGTFTSPSSQGFPQSVQDIISKETPKATDSSPLGNKAAQINQMLQNRYQVLNPGKTLPPEYALTADSTQKDYDRVDKSLDANEKAMGTKAQQDQANEFRKQTIAIQQQTAAAKNQKQSLDEQAIETAAQTLAKMDPNDLSSLKDVASMRGDQRLLIYNRAKQINPQFNTSLVDRRIKMMDNFTNGKDGQNLQSFGTFLQHAGTASDIVNNIRNTNMPIINKPMNWLAKNAAGDPNYVQLQAALEPVKAEAENFMLNGHAMHDADKQAIDTILSADSSPAQMQAAIKQLGHTVQARYTEMDNRFHGVMNQHLPADSISDEAKAGAAKIGITIGNQSQPQQQQSNAPQAQGNSIRVQIPGYPPGTISADQKDAFLKKHPGAQVLQ